MIPEHQNAPARSYSSGEGTCEVLAALASQTTNLAALRPRERDLWMDGYQWGRTSGLDDGWQRGYAACDNEIATLQRTAAEIVHKMAGLPEVDPHESRQRRRRIDNYFDEPTQQNGGAA